MQAPAIAQQINKRASKVVENYNFFTLIGIKKKSKSNRERARFAPGERRSIHRREI